MSKTPRPWHPVFGAAWDIKAGVINRGPYHAHLARLRQTATVPGHYRRAQSAGRESRWLVLYAVHDFIRAVMIGFDRMSRIDRIIRKCLISVMLFLLLILCFGFVETVLAVSRGN